MNKWLTAAIVWLGLSFLVSFQFKPSQQFSLINPFDTLKYDRAVAYDYNGEAHNAIVIDGKLNRYKKFKSGTYSGQVDRIYGQKVLAKNQLMTFHKTIGDTATYGGPTAACFDPHLGIVYYKGEKIAGHISVCIRCNYLEASHLIPATRFKKGFIDAEKTMETTLYGFSQKGREKLNNFCKELQFTTCMDSLEHHLFYQKN